jgi:hypothetical protein
MNPKCSCGADISHLTSKIHEIKLVRKFKLIFCEKCGEIHGIVEVDNFTQILDKIKKKLNI